MIHPSVVSRLSTTYVQWYVFLSTRCRFLRKIRYLVKFHIANRTDNSIDTTHTFTQPPESENLTTTQQAVPLMAKLELRNTLRLVLSIVWTAGRFPHAVSLVVSTLMSIPVVDFNGRMDYTPHSEQQCQVDISHVEDGETALPGIIVVHQCRFLSVLFLRFLTQSWLMSLVYNWVLIK